MTPQRRGTYSALHGNGRTPAQPGAVDSPTKMKTLELRTGKCSDQPDLAGAGRDGHPSRTCTQNTPHHEHNKTLKH